MIDRRVQTLMLPCADRHALAVAVRCAGSIAMIPEIERRCGVDPGAPFIRRERPRRRPARPDARRGRARRMVDRAGSDR